MRAKLKNPQILSKAIDIISELVSEVRIKISEFGMSITALDPANVAMVHFRIPKSAFLEFEGEAQTLGVNLENLKQILKRAGTASILSFERRENDLEIQIVDRVKRNFTLRLIDIEREDKDLPQLEHSAHIELHSPDFIAAIEDCAIVSDACSFIAEPTKFIISAKDLNTATSEFSADEAFIKAEAARARYSMEYLQKFVKGAKLCERVSIKFASDNPLHLEFRNEHLDLTFILAPRVENN